VVRGDHAGLVSILSPAAWPVDSLQLIGSGLLTAVREGTDGSADPARKCVNALRERGWDGDEELAELLDAASGTGPAPLLRPLPVDLEELSMILEGDPVHGGGRIDLHTGDDPELAIGCHAFSEERKRGRARSRLATEGYAATRASRPSGRTQHSVV